MTITEPRRATQTDQELIVRVAAGDAGAFEAIYGRHHRPALALARRIVGRSGAAEEATQDAFLSLWRAAGRFDPDRASVRGWLLTIVRNRSVDALRTGARHAQHEPLPQDAADRIAGPCRTDEDVLAAQQCTDVRRLVAELSPEQREVIGLAYVAGYTQSEIATRVGIPLGTVKGRTRLALLKLHEAATRNDADAPQAPSASPTLMTT